MNFCSEIFTFVENIPQPDYSDEEDSGFIKQSIESKLKKVYENVPSGIVAFDDWDPGDRTNTRGGMSLVGFAYRSFGSCFSLMLLIDDLYDAVDS